MTDRPGVDTGGFGGPRRWSTGKILATIAGLGCLAFVLLMVTCVGGGALWLKRTTGTATTEVKPFLEMVSRGEYEEAYDGIAASWKEELPFERFREDFAAMSERLGALEDLSVRGLRIESGERTTRDVTYLGTYERGRAMIYVRLQTEDDGVERIAGVRFDFRLDEADAPDDPAERLERIEGVTVQEGASPPDDADRD